MVEVGDDVLEHILVLQAGILTELFDRGGLIHPRNGFSFAVDIAGLVGEHLGEVHVEVSPVEVGDTGARLQGVVFRFSTHGSENGVAGLDVSIKDRPGILGVRGGSAETADRVPAVEPTVGQVRLDDILAHRIPRDVETRVTEVVGIGSAAVVREAAERGGDGIDETVDGARHLCLGRRDVAGLRESLLNAAGGQRQGSEGD